MSVNSHLTETASKAVLSSTENASIGTSVSNLADKIKSWFGADVTEHFKFGSFTRDTILPRKVDEHSDVDYMVVFKDDKSKPQTYLDRLKRFVEAKYTRSEIKQSHPTIVLELSHIKFELVPAISIYGGYNIPAPASNWQDWMATSPNAFNTSLTNANKQHSFLVKPLVRLLKYWNANAGYPSSRKRAFAGWRTCSNQRNWLIPIDAFILAIAKVISMNYFVWPRQKRRTFLYARASIVGQESEPRRLPKR